MERELFPLKCRHTHSPPPPFLPMSAGRTFFPVNGFFLGGQLFSPFELRASTSSRSTPVGLRPPFSPSFGAGKSPGIKTIHRFSPPFFSIQCGQSDLFRRVSKRQGRSAEKMKIFPRKGEFRVLFPALNWSPMDSFLFQNFGHQQSSSGFFSRMVSCRFSFPFFLRG